jgi:ketosteroid isomerase-like protein
MRGYENSPDTTYVSSRAVIRGYASIRRHYASAYSGAMGRLSIADVSIRMLGADYAVIVARWHLALTNSTRPTGLFTLVLHRSRAGWKIVSDHSP